MSKKLEEMKRTILADGIIDAEEVLQIKKVIYEDGKIDQEEADFLFELNDAVSGKENHPSWKELMVEAVTKFLLEDEISPNVVDEKEADWLITKIDKDGVLDDIEKSILLNLKTMSSKIPEKLLKKIEAL